MTSNIIIDTNIIVSVLISNNIESPTYKVLKLAFDKKVKLHYTNDIYDEYKDVLNREKFGFNKHLIGSLLNEISKIGIKHNVKIVSELLIDKKDIPFYDLFLSLRGIKCYLLTGNIKHFPNNKYIMTPTEFITNKYKKSD